MTTRPPPPPSQADARSDGGPDADELIRASVEPFRNMTTTQRMEALAEMSRALLALVNQGLVVRDEGMGDVWARDPRSPQPPAES